MEADATQRARNIPKKSFFLMHGLADLTAPYQHGVALARALAEAGILFRYQVRTAQLYNFNLVGEDWISSWQIVNTNMRQQT